VAEYLLGGRRLPHPYERYLTLPIDYRRYGGRNVAVVLLPSICHQHLVVLSVNDGTGGWTIWDFITNRKLENERSSRLLRDIETEADANHGEYPPFYNLEDPGHPERWELYLILRTIARHRRHNSKAHPAFRGVGVTSSSISAPSNALPRFRTL